LTFDMQKKLESIKAKVKLIAANAEPAYAEASAWQALTGLAVGRRGDRRRNVQHQKQPSRAARREN